MKIKYIGPNSMELPTGSIHEVISIEKGWYRIMIPAFGQNYIFPPEAFEIVEGSADDVPKWDGPHSPYAD